MEFPDKRRFVKKGFECLSMATSGKLTLHRGHSGVTIPSMRSLSHCERNGERFERLLSSTALFLPLLTFHLSLSLFSLYSLSLLLSSKTDRRKPTKFTYLQAVFFFHPLPDLSACKRITLLRSPPTTLQSNSLFVRRSNKTFVRRYIPKYFVSIREIF